MACVHFKYNSACVCSCAHARLCFLVNFCVFVYACHDAHVCVCACVRICGNVKKEARACMCVRICVCLCSSYVGV